MERNKTNETIEPMYVAYSAYQVPYASDWSSWSNAWAEVQRQGHGAVYVKTVFSEIVNSELLKMLQKTWGRNGTVGTHLPACKAVQGPFPRPLDRNECDCGFDEAQMLLRSFGVD